MILCSKHFLTFPSYGQAVCYRNSYPDGYHQYGCGLSSDATTVETTFSGQDPAFTLEIVRTAITFPTPSSSFISPVKTSEISTSSTPIRSTLTTSTLTILSGSNGSQVAANSTESKIAISGQENQAQLGLIIGSIIGGIGALFALLAIGVYLMRRRQNGKEPEVYLFPPVEKHPYSGCVELFLDFLMMKTYAELSYTVPLHLPGPLVIPGLSHPTQTAQFPL